MSRPLELRRFTLVVLLLLQESLLDLFERKVFKAKQQRLRFNHHEFLFDFVE